MRPDPHPGIHQQGKTRREEEQLTVIVISLQAVQAEVDGATQTACDLRQKMVEKDVALELTACHLRQQEAARSTLQEAIISALSLLHQAAFQVCAWRGRG